MEVVDDFILNTHVLAKLMHTPKNKNHVKTANIHKEFSHWQKKMHAQYIQQPLTNIPSNPFHGPAWNTMSCLEISSKIINGLLAPKETGKKFHLEFVKNRVTSHDTSFLEILKKSGVTYKEE